jgi:predicted component of type VI protein secretion system
VSDDSLRELLARVHAKLSSAQSLDASSRELLITVMRDIERTLGGSPSTQSMPAETLPRLEALAVRFEVEHPAVAQLLRQIGTLLGQAGI